MGKEHITKRFIIAHCVTLDALMRAGELTVIIQGTSNV